MGTVLRPNAVMVPVQCLPPRNAVGEAEISLQPVELAYRHGDPTAEDRGHEAVAKLHLQIGPIERLAQVPSQGSAVLPVDRVTQP